MHAPSLLLLSLVGIAIATGETAARADDSHVAAPGPGELRPTESGATNRDDRALERLANFFDLVAAQARTYGTWGGLVASGAGAVTIGGGIEMLNDDAHSRSGGLLVVLGSGEVLGGGLLLMTSIGPRAPFEHLSTMLAEQRTSGRPPAQIVAAIETEWARRAEEARETRQVAGAVALSFGVVALGAGTFLAASNPSVSSLTRSERNGIALVCYGGGFLAAMAGVNALLLESPIELSRRAYEQGSPRHSPRPGLQGVSYVPVVHGGVLSLGGAF